MGWLVQSSLSDKKHDQIVADAQQALLPGTRSWTRPAGWWTSTDTGENKPDQVPWW